MTARERLRRSRGFAAGCALGLAVALTALLGPPLTADPDAVDYSAVLRAPSASHRLGTDAAGRDVLARTVTAARTSLGDALLVSLLTAAIGMLVGGLAGYLRGRVDAVLSRLIDVMLGLPDLVIALAIVGALGVGRTNLLLALSLTGWAVTARVTRAVALGSHDRLDVVAARLAGVPPRRIVLQHVLPGALSQVLVLSATGFGGVVLALAGLSFLGLGAQPPTAELGQMLDDSRGDLAIAPWLAIGPTVVVAVTVAAGMLLSEALRDALSVTPTESRRGFRRGVLWSPAASAGPGDGALRVRGLRVTYPDGTEAVRGVDLDVAPGECVAVIGESGCGKTTIVRALLQLLPDGSSVSGHVAVAGRSLPLTGAAERELHGLVAGYVAQDPYAAVDPVRPVGHHVRQAWRYHRVRPPDDIAARVAALGVADAADRLRDRPFTWSGGMLQRATVAAATAHRPRLVVADEPTSALDAHLADGVLETLRRDDSAVLLVSHDLRLVARHADRVVVMRDGAVVETGPAADVVRDPAHEYTRLLLAVTPDG